MRHNDVTGSRRGAVDGMAITLALAALVIAFSTALYVYRPGAFTLCSAASEDGRVTAEVSRQKSGLKLSLDDTDRHGQWVELALDSSKEPSAKLYATGKGNGNVSWIGVEGGVLDFNVMLRGRATSVHAQDVAKMIDDLYDRIEFLEARVVELQGRPSPLFKPRRYP